MSRNPDDFLATIGAVTIGFMAVFCVISTGLFWIAIATGHLR